MRPYVFKISVGFPTTNSLDGVMWDVLLCHVCGASNTERMSVVITRGNVQISQAGMKCCYEGSAEYWAAFMQVQWTWLIVALS